jgi:hypothetical protein
VVGVGLASVGLGNLAAGTLARHWRPYGCCCGSSPDRHSFCRRVPR